MTDYKTSKEAFVSGMTGSSIRHINMISLAALVSLDVFCNRDIQLIAISKVLYCIVLCAPDASAPPTGPSILLWKCSRSSFRSFSR